MVASKTCSPEPGDAEEVERSRERGREREREVERDTHTNTETHTLTHTHLHTPRVLMLYRTKGACPGLCCFLTTKMAKSWRQHSRCGDKRNHCNGKEEKKKGGEERENERSKKEN